MLCTCCMWFILQPHFTKACYRMLKLQLRAAYQAYIMKLNRVYSARLSPCSSSHKPTSTKYISPTWTNHSRIKHGLSILLRFFMHDFLAWFLESCLFSTSRFCRHRIFESSTVHPVGTFLEWEIFSWNMQFIKVYQKSGRKLKVHLTCMAPQHKRLRKKLI